MAIARRANVTCAHGPGCPHDIGEAAGSVDGLSALGRLSALRLPDLGVAAFAMGAGPITRRQATPAELAAVAARDGTPSGASAIQRRWNGNDPAYRPAKEEPVPATAPPVIPCVDCLHVTVCRLKDNLPTGDTFLHESILGPGLRLVFTGAHVECDHHLTSLGASTSGRVVAIAAPSDAERMQASRMRGAAARVAQARHQSKAGERAEIARRGEEALAALERHGGDQRAAAAELGLRGTGFAMVVKHARARREAVPA